MGVAVLNARPDFVAATVPPFEGGATPALDLAHLRRFTGANRALEREVLQLFAEQAPCTLQAMQHAETPKGWRDAAHTLKGSAFAVGATAIGKLAAEAEALRIDPSRWPEMIERLSAAVADARRFISGELAV